MSRITNLRTFGIASLAILTGFVGGIIYRKPILHRAHSLYPVAWHQYGHNAHRHPVFRAALSRPQSWTYLVDRGGIASPASIASGTVYVGTNGNQVAAIRDGRELWKVTVLNQVMTTPLIGHHLVIVGVGNKAFSSQHVRGTGWSGIVALKQSSGKTAWMVRTVGEAMPTPVLYGNRIYAATGAGHVDVIRWASGTLVNRISLAGSYVSMSSPLLHRRHLYVGGALPYALYGIDLTSEKVRFRHSVPAQGGLDDCSPAWADGYITTQYTNYLNATGTRMSATMMAIQPNGQVAWHTLLGRGRTALDEMQVGQPTVVKNTIYVGSPVTDRIYAISARTGRIKWHTFVGAAVRGNPAIVADQLLVGDSAGRLDTLSARTGNLLKQVQLTQPTSVTSKNTPTPTGFSGAGPVIHGRTLYIVSMNGEVLARPLHAFLDKPHSYGPMV